MHSTNEIPVRDRRGLREFGLVTGGIVAVLFGLFFPWLLERPWPWWPWALAGVLVLWALIAPSTMNPVYRSWMRLGLVLGWVSSRIVLSVVFYILITPVGLVMRLFKRDPMKRKCNSSMNTYRIQSSQRSKNHMERPF